MLQRVRRLGVVLILLASSTELRAQFSDTSGVGASGGIPGCHTQIIFDQKRADNPSALNPEACTSYGVCDNPAVRDSFQPQTGAAITYIRLYFHVLAQDDGSSPATTEANVASQVAVLNQDYLPYHIQFEYNMRFVNDVRYRLLDQEYEFNQMKSLYALEPSRQINIYVAAVNIAGEVFSFGTFPWDSDALGYRGGVVMNRTQFYPSEPATLTHEIGHCLGLYHTFRGVSETTTCGPCYEAVGANDRDVTGDLCSDTEPTPLNYYCSSPGGTDPCTTLGWGPTDPQNYMSYAYSSCQDEFTPQQTGRIYCWIDSRLQSWVIAFDLTATPTFGPAPLPVDFGGTTERLASSWSWDFGDAGSSDLQNPSHEYINPGYYNVSATIETPTGSYTRVQIGMISAYADTLRLEDTEIRDGLARVDVYVRNYLPLREITIPVSYDGPAAVELDSASTVGWRSESMTASRISWVDSWNMSTVRIDAGSGPYLEPGSGPVASLYLTSEGGSIGETPIVVEEYSIYSLEFITYAGSYVPVDIGGVISQGCCQGTVGDANLVGGDSPTIGDISTIIDHLFISGSPLECYAEADVNQSGGTNPTAEDITIGDVSVLIDHLFISGRALPSCL